MWGVSSKFFTNRDNNTLENCLNQIQMVEKFTDECLSEQTTKGRARWQNR